MSNINGSNNFIKFGKQQVELSKSDGVKRETVAGKQGSENSIMSALFNRFDKNKDGILDNLELNEVYTLIKNASKNGSMSKAEAKNLAKQLGVDVSREDVQNFTQILAEENDSVSAERNGNTYTVKDGNKTTVTEYADDNHTQPKKITVKDGNTTTVTEFNGTQKTVTTTIGTGDNIVSTTTETFDGNTKTSKTVTKGQVTQYYNGDDKVIKKEEQTPKGFVTTEYEYDNNGEVSKTTQTFADGKKIVTAGNVVTEYDSSGKAVKETVKNQDGTTVKEFGDDGNPVKVTETLSDGNISTTVINEKGTVVTISKDGHNLSQTVSKDGKTYEVAYDGSGNTKGVIVQNGESPAVIAKKFGVTKEALLEANKGILKGKKGHEYFLVGQEIVIPKEIAADNFSRMNAGRKTKEQSVNAYKDAMAEKARLAAEAQEQIRTEQVRIEDEKKAVKNAELTKQGADIAKALYDDMDGLGTKNTFNKHLEQITSENAAQVVLGYRQVSREESIAEAILDEKGMSLEKRQNALRGIFNNLIEQAKTEGIFDETTLNNYKTQFEAKIRTHQRMIGGSDFKGFDELFEGIASGITSTSILTSAERKQIAAQTPEQQQDYVVNTLTETINNSKSSFDNQLKRDGWAADLADGMSVLWASKNRADLVREDLAKFETQLGKLKDATPAEFPNKFYEVFGVEYNPQMVAAYEKRKGQMVEVNAMYGYEQTFNKDMSALLIHKTLREETDTQTVDPMTGMTTTIVTATKDQVYTREFGKLARYMGSGDENAGAVAIKERMLQKGINPATATKDEQYAVLREIAQNVSQSLHNNVMTMTENKGYDAFKVESDKMYAAAFGTGNDIAKRVEDYNVSQQTGEAVVKGTAKAVGAIAVAALTGGAGLGVVALSTVGISAAVDFSDELTRGVGQADDVFGKMIQNGKDMSADQVVTILKNAAIDGATVYAGGKLTQGLMNAKNFVKIGGQMVGDIAVGAAAEYAQTGEITINGVLFQVAFSAAGNLVALRQAPKGTKPHSAPETPVVEPLKGRDIVEEGVIAGRADQSHLNAKERALVEQGLADSPTPQEVEAFQRSLGEAPTPEQRVDIDAHNARVAEANAKAHQIGENLSDEALAGLRGESPLSAAAKPEVNPQIKAFTDEINGLDGSIKRLEAQISGAKKFGKNTQKLEEQLQKLQQQRSVKSAEFKNGTWFLKADLVQDNINPTTRPHIEDARANSTPVDNGGFVVLTPEQRMKMGQIGSNINAAKSLDDLANAQAWLDKMPDCSQKSALQKQINAKSESLRTASVEQPKVQNIVNERINENGVFEKGKPVIVDADSKLVLGGQYELDLSSPTMQTKIKNLKDGETLTVGRNGDIKVPDVYNAVSRKHIEITRQGDNIVVKDISTNGTKIKVVSGAENINPNELVRYAGNQGKSIDQNYIRASQDLRDHYNMAIETGNYADSPEQYIATMQRAHQIAYAGKDGNHRWYEKVGGGSLEINPGQIRSEGSLVSNRAKEGEFVENIAQKYGDSYSTSSASRVNLKGIDQEGLPRNLSTKHYYPDGKYMSQYFEQMQRTSKEALNLIEKGASEREILSKIAEHYQYAANARPFGQINNSLFMNEINTLLKKAGMKTIPHGMLDHAAQRLQPESFSRYFIDEYYKTAL